MSSWTALEAQEGQEAQEAQEGQEAQEAQEGQTAMSLLGRIGRRTGWPTTALIRSREACLGYSQISPSISHFPGFGGYCDLLRLSANVRRKILMAELNKGICISITDNTLLLKIKSDKCDKSIVEITRPSQVIFEGQTSLTINWTISRTERAPEIISQLTPQYTYWATILNLSAVNTPRTLDLIAASLMWASLIVQQIKHIMNCPRPIAYSPLVQPLIPVPLYSAYPSGHATEAFMVARLLQKISGNDIDSEVDTQLQRQAERIATNRVVAGLHFPVDTACGQVLGEALANYILACSTTNNALPYCFDGASWKPDQEFSLLKVDACGDEYCVLKSELISSLSREASYEWGSSCPK